MIKLAKLIKEIMDVPPNTPTINTNFNHNYSDNFINYIKSVENGVKAGYKDGKWYPYKSVEGGNDTIAYGHKLISGEDFSGGITEKEATELLEKDLQVALNIVLKYHKWWVDDYIKDVRNRAKKNPNGKYYKFFMNLKPSDQVFKLNDKQIEILTDFAFNLGSLKKFPTFADSVFRKDWEEAKKEYKRFYKDRQGKKHELGRNIDFHNQYLK